MARDFDSWVDEIAKITQPDAVHIVNGSEGEAQTLFRLLLDSKTVFQLNPEKRPNSYLAWSNPEDVARVEDKTFICSKREIDAGPTNNWQDPQAMRERLLKLFSGSMRGRTMYVVPYCMGPIGSPYGRYGVEITDSPYVVVNLRIMTRVNEEVLAHIRSHDFVRCVHSVGVPLSGAQKDVPWPCNTKDLVIAHFPETEEVWSFGSGYGGNALLSKKCFALRLASSMARSQGWLAEHMLIIGVTNPEGKKKYMTASFPSACGKTNLAMLESTLPGWKVECVGDDIAWMFWDEEGVLRAVNPEFGFFGVAPGTSTKTNKYAMSSIQKNSIFTNVGRTQDGDVWWEGMTPTPPPGLTTWKNEPYDPASGKTAAHPNARFTAPVRQCPTLDPAWNDPRGVPISAIFFGGRRATTVPVVRQAATWQQGVFFGASMTSETTAAAKGVVGQVRHDPFAMLPFCGYNMGDYFSHWLSMDVPGRKLPAIFYVNWFLKDDEGKFLWPGFGENARVLAWAFDRLEGRATARSTPIGSVPERSTFLLPDGCNYDALFKVDVEAWKKEIEELQGYFSRFGEKLPKAVTLELEKMSRALAS
jgi:phosphoenolpyruvate carboxykinase (GTP)